jgi:hypothetical protein
VTYRPKTLTRIRLLVLGLAVLAAASFGSCGGGGETIKLFVTPSAVKYISATTKNFVIEVEGIEGSTYITHVALAGPNKSSFSFVGGVPNCEGAPVGGGKTCSEQISLPVYSAGLSAELEVKVGGLRQVAKLTT